MNITIYVTRHLTDPVTMYRTTQYVIYVTAYVSIYTLVLMAGDRSVSCGMWHFVIHLV